MHKDALRVAHYWRNSLADAGMGRGGLKTDDVTDFIFVSESVLQNGQLGKDIAEALFAKDDEHILSKPMVLRPYIYRAKTLHTQRRANLPDIVTPIVSKLSITRSGAMTIPTFTCVARDLLEPNDQRIETIGHVEALDTFLTKFPTPADLPAREHEGDEPETAWERYWRYCQDLAEHIFPAFAFDDRFERVLGGYIDDSNRGDAGEIDRQLYT